MHKLRNLAQRFPLFLIGGTLFFALILLFGLLQFAPLPNSQKNGFVRRMLLQDLKPIKTLNLQLPLEQVCGATAHHIFFTVPNPSWLIAINDELTEFDTLKFSIPNVKQVIGSNNLEVDSPHVYFFANNLSSIFKGIIGQKRMDSVRLPIPSFTRSTRISNRYAIVRSLTSSLDKQLFHKIDLSNGTIIGSEEVTEKSGLGGFESDGILQYDSESKNIIYVEYNRNLFYCLDSNLQQQYLAHTIDTISHNTGEIQRVKLGTEDKIMPVKPRINVNSLFCSGNGFIFIMSALKADNEQASLFTKNAVIDLYDIERGNYHGSIYIPFIDGQKIKSISIWNDQLVVLYNKQLCTFSLKNLPPLIANNSIKRTVKE